MRLREALRIQRGEMVAFVGAGGKTSALFRLKPRDFALAAVGPLDRGVEDPLAGRPDVRARSIAAYERQDRVVGDSQGAVSYADTRTARWSHN